MTAFWIWLSLMLAFALASTNIRWLQKVRRLRREQDRALAAVEARWREETERHSARQNTLLNGMTEGLLALDAEGRIQLTNRAFDRLFTVRQPVRGKRIYEAFQLNKLEELARRLGTQEQVLDFELDFPGDRARCLQVNAASIFDEDGLRVGAVMIFHDLTQLKELERTRQEFVANVSHELRTPLSMIKGYAETLLAGALTDAQVSTRFLQTIERHADRLACLIDDLLTISHLESGQMNIDLRPIILNAAVGSVFNDLKDQAERKQMRLLNLVPEGCEVRADGGRLRQVLWNLIENAVKYGAAGGHVTVRAKAEAPEVLQISVEDDGAGIPPDCLPRIFERFYRVDKARSREAGGTGLGLSIVKHIVQRHGGGVWAESHLGRGSTFYFTLPLVATASRVQPPQPAPHLVAI